MVGRKGVMLVVDEKFFNVLEKERQAEQSKIRRKTGGWDNLTQRNFTAILAEKNFRFKFPKIKRSKLKR